MQSSNSVLPPSHEGMSEPPSFAWRAAVAAANTPAASVSAAAVSESLPAGGPTGPTATPAPPPCQKTRKLPVLFQVLAGCV